MWIHVPETFDLAGFTWQVRYKKMRDFGHTDFNRHRITLRQGMEGDVLRQTFLHELLHAINYAMGLNEFNKAKHDAKVDAYASLLYQAFKSRHGVLTRPEEKQNA